MEVQALYVTFAAFVLMLAFAVRGGTGFGGATIAVPALSFVVPIGVAVSVLAVLSTINSIDIVRREWRIIAWSELRRLLPFGAASGSIYAINLNVRKLDKSTFRATVTSVMLVGLLIRIGGYAELGLYGWLPLTMIVAGLPMMFIGAWLGDRLLRNLDEKAFARVLAGVLMVSGAGLLLS